ncbi:metal ABC transporter permease [Halobacteriovorax sp.]|uniref:metal ABC transporter permease n=1 Tax=Halobacteriovorax sp. TaxID=2020862 RepID=UPI00356625AC
MLEMILFYKLSFITSTVSGGVLSVIGKHFIWRNKFLELFTLCQFAIIGNLLGNLILPDLELPLIPLVTSVVFFIFGKFLFDFFKVNAKERSTRMICIYLVLASSQYLIISLFPNLETHLSNGLFGSMVTATHLENWIIISIFLIISVGLFFLNSSITKNSLEISFFQRRKKHIKDEYFLLIPVVIGVFGLGLIYTLSFLSLGAVILGTSFKNQKTNNIALAVINIIASIGGLLLSLYFENLSTTPLQVVLLALICLITKVFNEKLLK